MSVESKASQRPIVLTIVTVVKNNRQALSATLDSVRRQRSPFWEYIVVDGRSSDGTVELLSANSDLIDRWISEEDSGLYEAMNKGIQLACGDWLWLLNAGDCLCDGAVQSALEVLAGPARERDIVYGAMMRIGRGYQYLVRERNLTDLRRGVSFNHVATLVRRDLYRRLNGYDTRYRISADYDFFSRAVRAGARVLYIDQAWATMTHGGISETIRFLPVSAVEIFRIDWRNMGFPGAVRHAVTYTFWGFAKKVMRNTAEALGLTRLVRAYFHARYRHKSGKP